MLALMPMIVGASDFDTLFKIPPESTKPWCYWYWLNGDITREGLTKDLEMMAEVGINRVMIGNVNLINKTGPVKMMSPEWMDLTRHVMREGNRLGVDIYMFNGPGWSQSGGPWIRPDQSMRRVTWQEFPAKGGLFSRKVRPKDVLSGQDIAVLALPRLDTVSIEGESKKGETTLVFTHSEPFTARSLQVKGNARCKLYATQGEEKVLVAEFDAKPGNAKTDFLPDGMQTFSFKDTTAKSFVLEFEFRMGNKVRESSSIEAILSSEPRVAQVLNKQMARMHPTPAPTWESYIFHDTLQPDDTSVLVRQNQILDLSDLLNEDGKVTAELPEGNWTVLYFGMVPTGKKNHPAPPEATGYEVDKMSREHVRHHFKGQFAELLKQLAPEERATFKGITIDSYEVGAQNWTDGFAAEFMERNGYNPIKLLPVFTGRVIDSAQTSDQFLWDLRRSVADMIAEYYVGGLREIANEHDLVLWCENYGHWGFPGDFLVYGAYADELGGEFWIRPSDRGTIECRAASSAVNVYGKQRAYGEAFTSNLELTDHPYSFKARGEQLFCEGINHFVLHVYAHQPEDGIPGTNPWFGTPFHRNTPWFRESREWITYLQRCHMMLQQGERDADVLVYIGDFAPQMIGPANPVPEGYDYDYVGSDAILHTLHVVDGEWVVYDQNNPQRISARWSVLALPELKYIRPHVQKRIEALRQAGGKVIDSVPVSAQALEQEGLSCMVSDTNFGVRWVARRLEKGMLFFISNFEKAGTFKASLRVDGMQPELLNPVTGEVFKIARYQSEKGRTTVTIDVKDPSDSYFIVFRDATLQPSVIEASAPDSELHLYFDEDDELVAESYKVGKYMITLSDGKQHEVVFDETRNSHFIEGPWESSSQEDNTFSILMKTSFDLPAEFSNGQRVLLDLGQVEVMVRVTLNGRTYDTLWMPPFELDVTDKLKPGKNALEVLVTSTSESKPKLGQRVQLRTLTHKAIK